MVPPLAVTPTWSGMRAMTGWRVVWENSPDWASAMPQTCRAVSITAICIPRQIPKKGMFCSRAYRMAEIIPSIPRSPKPPGTRMPSAPASISAALPSVTASESTQRSFTLTPFSMPPWVRASTTDR